jgi:hypothetical protein
VVHVLPNPMISIGGHRLEKLPPLYGLDRRLDLDSTKPKRGSGSRCNDRCPYPGCGNLKSIKVVGWLPLFHHAEIYTFKV